MAAVARVAVLSCWPLFIPRRRSSRIVVVGAVARCRRPDGRYVCAAAMAARRRRQRVAAAPLDVAFVIAQEIALSVLGLLAPLSHPSPIAQHSPAQYSETENIHT